MLNTALVGFGYASRVFHAPLLLATDEIALKTVVSRDADKVARSLPSVKTMPDLDGVLSDDSIDLVVIATPNETHAPLAERALVAGKHVVVDKPFTITAAEGKRLSALARQHHRILSVFHNRRWDGDFLSLQRVLAAGSVGIPVTIESRFDRYRPAVRDRWRERPGPGSGLWYDLGPHLVDQALHLFRKPKALSVDIGVQREGGLVDDYFSVTLFYERTRAIVQAGMLVAGSPPRFRLDGTLGSFETTGFDPQEAALVAGHPPGSTAGSTQITARLWRGDVHGVREEKIIPDTGDYRRYYRSLVRAILEGEPNPVPPEDAIDVMTVIEAAALTQRGHVTLDGSW